MTKTDLGRKWGRLERRRKRDVSGNRLRDWGTGTLGRKHQRDFDMPLHWLLSLCIFLLKIAFSLPFTAHHILWSVHGLGKESAAFSFKMSALFAEFYRVTAMILGHQLGNDICLLSFKRATDRECIQPSCLSASQESPPCWLWRPSALTSGRRCQRSLTSKRLIFT